MNVIEKLESWISPGGVITTSQSGFDTFMQSVLHFLGSMVDQLVSFLMQICYIIGKFVLIMIDFLFVFVRQFTGINIDFSDISSLDDSDILFKFLLSDPVVDVIKAILAIAVVLVIIFSIIAIVKSEYLAATTGANNNKGQILSGALKSIFMMVLVPVIALGSIFLSNAVLETLYNVTSGGASSVSLGTEVFLASAYDANVYRYYASSDNRIPITYNFDEVTSDDNVAGWAGTGTVAEMEEAYIAFRNQSVWERGLTTYWMFYNTMFESMDAIEKADELAFNSGDTEGSAFHKVYDEGLYYKKVEYYQMAEVADYSMKTHSTLYFKTPQDIKRSWQGVSNIDSKYLGLFYDYGGSVNFQVRYTEDGGLPTDYSSKNQANIQDEAKGSTFVVCRRETDANGKDYFVPLLAGYDFASAYTDGINPVVARGLFEDGKYPTAIREEGNVVSFYRDKLNVPFFVDLFPRISYELPEGTTEDFVSKVLKLGVSYITGVDVNQYIPYLYYNFDVFNMFSKVNRTVATLDAGEFYLNYTFNDDDIVLTNFYSYHRFNILMLIFCAGLLVMLLFRAVFGITARVFDLVLLFITYPAVCATIVMDGGQRFKSWTEVFVNKLLSVYALVLSINMVLLLYPVVERINIFSLADFERAQALFIIPNSWSVGFVNMLIRWLFVFCLFGFLDIGIGVIAELLGYKLKGKAIPDWEKDKKKGWLNKTKDPESNVADRGDLVIDSAKNVVKTAGDVISGKMLVDTIKEGVGDVVGMIPGSAIYGEWKDKKKFKAGQDKITGAQGDLEAAMMSGKNADIEKSTKALEGMIQDKKK